VAKVTFEKELTALLVIDPYNDFISEGGKIWGRIKNVAEAKAQRNHCWDCDGKSSSREITKP